jgi:general secretion pathway protein A
MFLEFYQLKRQPFGVTPDPHFLYFGASHEQAFSSLLSSVRERRGFSAVIAKPGMGKTSLIFKLLDLLKDSARTGFLFQTHGDSREVLSTLLHDLDAGSCGDDWPSMQRSLNAALLR